MYRFTVLLGVVFAMFFVAGSAQAQSVDYFMQVSNALQTSPVYVQPGTESTTGDTAATLANGLNRDDNIVLVMLPKAAASAVDPKALAVRLSTKENNGKIVGMMVGDQAVGYALSLPPDVAVDQMHRAASVSANPVETLVTFVQNIHAWVKSNPGAVTTFVSSPSSASDQQPYPWWGYAVWIIGGFVLVFAFYKLVTLGGSGSHGGNSRSEVRFVASDEVTNLLRRIQELSECVRDDELRPCLIQCCEDTQRYFREYSHDISTDALAFGECLSAIVSVLEGYISVLDHQSDFNNARKRLHDGKTFIMKATASIVELIRSRNDVTMVAYDVAVSYDPEKGFVPRYL